MARARQGAKTPDTPRTRQRGDPPSTPAQKRAAWQQLMLRRLGSAHDELTKIAKLGDREYYHFTEGDVGKVLETLMRDVENIKYAHETGGRPAPLVQFDDMG